MAVGRIGWAEVRSAVTGRIGWAAVLAAAPSIFTLTAEAGAYTLTGQDATLGTLGLRGRIGWAEVSLDVTGAVYTLNAEAGAYAMSWAGSTGQVVLDAEPGAYAMAGQDADLTFVPIAVFYLTADVGVYTLTGQDATLTGPAPVDVSAALTGAAAASVAGNVFVIAPVVGWTPVDDSISNAWIPVDDSNAALWA